MKRRGTEYSRCCRTGSKSTTVAEPDGWGVVSEAEQRGGRGEWGVFSCWRFATASHNTEALWPPDRSKSGRNRAKRKKKGVPGSLQDVVPLFWHFLPFIFSSGTCRSSHTSCVVLVGNGRFIYLYLYRRKTYITAVVIV